MNWPMLSERIRLDEFRRRHPEVDIHKGDFGVWHASLPLEDGNGYDGGSRNIAEYDLGILLGKLTGLFPRPG